MADHGVKHVFQSAQPDSTDNTKASKNEWNDYHDIASIDWPLTRPANPIHGSMWAMLISTSPVRLQLHVHLIIGGTGRDFLIMDIVTPPEV